MKIPTLKWKSLPLNLNGINFRATGRAQVKNYRITIASNADIRYSFEKFAAARGELLASIICHIYCEMWQREWRFWGFPAYLRAKCKRMTNRKRKERKFLLIIMRTMRNFLKKKINLETEKGSVNFPPCNQSARSNSSMMQNDAMAPPFHHQQRDQYCWFRCVECT